MDPDPYSEYGSGKLLRQKDIKSIDSCHLFNGVFSSRAPEIRNLPVSPAKQSRIATGLLRHALLTTSANIHMVYVNLVIIRTEPVTFN